MLLKPSIADFESLTTISKEIDSYDGGDQGILNQHFNSWYTDAACARLPFAFK
jgi:hypothetical protein